MSTADSNVGVDDATLSPGRDPSTGAIPPPGSRPTAGALAAAPVRRWTAVLAVVVAVLAAYTAVMLIGVREDAREERILGSLTPIFEWLRDTGANTHNWLQSHRKTAGVAGTVLLLLVAAGAVIGARRRAAPVVLLVGVFLLAIWAQVALQSDSTTLGAVLYLAAVAGAVGLGIWRPLHSLPTFPPFPPAPSTGAAASSDNRTASPASPISTYRAPISFGWECVLVLVLTLIALISRTWALTELYDFFDLETIEWIVQGRTWRGYLGYLDFGFVQNNGGAVQFLPTQVIYHLFGTSIFTLRMAAVLWGVAAVPLMYTLGRRLGGVGAGVLCSFFLITAPEQLFWARNENLHFAPMAVCALVTAHLALWLVERLSLAAVLVNALWMPWCRWFYSACMVAFLIPIATGVHALVFGRGFWRKAWYVIPGLAIGLTFWIFSLSVLRASMHEWQWQFVDPSAVYGASAWRKHGEFRDASMPDLIRLQAVSMSKNFSEVVRNMSYQTENFSHWCQRSQPAEHRTIMNVGLALLVFVGLGYLLGQPYDRRAFVLLAWWGIAVLPAILSQEPADRRMAMVFPASHAIAGTTLAAFFHLIWSRGGRLADVFATFAGAVGLAAIGLTNLSSHLLLPINPVLFSDYPRFTKPLLEESDAVFTNLPGPFRTLSVFGNIDHFLEAPTCLQYVEPQNWLATALDPQCAFDDPIYRLTIGDEATERLHKAYNPQRVSYLLTEEPTSAPQIALLRALHPHATLERHPVPRAERTLVAMTIDVGDINKLHSPVVAGDVPAQPILAGVRMRRGRATAEIEANGGSVVSGGIRVDADGWYRWRLDPPCPAAVLSLDGQPVSATDPQPMLAGVHPFTLQLAKEHGCALPLRIVMDGVVPHRLEALSPQHFVSPRVASLAEVRAPAVDAFAGYDQPQRLIEFRGRPVDFGIDAQGNFSVLMREGDQHRVRRYDKSGNEIAAWDVPTPLTINPASLAVAPDGTTAVLVQRTIQLYDPQGKQIGSWEHPWLVWETQLAFWGDYLIGNIHHRDALAVYSRDGQVVKEFKQFAGGPGKFYAPMAFAIGADGDLFVEQLDGKALRFRLEGPGFNPVFVEEFVTNASTPGSGFDGSDRVLVSSERGLRAFGRGGRRLMATDPKRDLSQGAFGNTVHVRRDGDKLFVLDSDRQSLWLFPG